jgi:hypothetical protein
MDPARPFAMLRFSRALRNTWHARASSIRKLAMFDRRVRSSTRFRRSAMWAYAQSVTREGRDGSGVSRRCEAPLARDRRAERAAHFEESGHVPYRGRASCSTSSTGLVVRVPELCAQAAPDVHTVARRDERRRVSDGFFARFAPSRSSLRSSETVHRGAESLRQLHVLCKMGEAWPGERAMESPRSTCCPTPTTRWRSPRATCTGSSSASSLSVHGKQVKDPFLAKMLAQLD